MYGQQLEHLAVYIFRSYALGPIYYYFRKSIILYLYRSVIACYFIEYNDRFNIILAYIIDVPLMFEILLNVFLISIEKRKPTYSDKTKNYS